MVRHKIFQTWLSLIVDHIAGHIIFQNWLSLIVCHMAGHMVFQTWLSLIVCQMAGHVVFQTRVSSTVDHMTGHIVFQAYASYDVFNSKSHYRYGISMLGVLSAVILWLLCQTKRIFIDRECIINGWCYEIIQGSYSVWLVNINT